MKSSLDKKEGLEHKLNIEVPADKVKEAFTKVYKDIQKNAELKGFRKGKAPIDKIKSMYADRVKQDVLQQLVSDSYQSALDEHSLDPIGHPDIQFDKFEEDIEFKFSAEFEIRPEITLNEYEKLKVEKEKLDVSDTKIDEVLENIQQSHPEMVPVFEDRGAENGDVAEISFNGFVNGAPLEGGSAESHMLELGANQFIPGFEEGVVGMKVGENKELNLTFPEEYHNSDIAGKPVTFKVEVKGLKKKSLPELNDELAKKVGDFSNVSELKDAIREDLGKNEEMRIQEDFKKRVLKALVEKNPVEVPKTLFVEQKNMLIEDVKRKMQQQGMNEDQFSEYKTKWDEDFSNSANFMIQSSFLVDALADKLNLRATPKDLEEKIKEFSERMGIELDKVREYYNSRDAKSRLAFQVTEEKVVNYLIDHADVTEVEGDKISKVEN